MIKHIITEIIKDPWAQLGYLGTTIAAISSWLIVNISEHVGTMSAVGGLIMVAVVIIEKLIDIRIKLRKLKDGEEGNEEDNLGV